MMNGFARLVSFAMLLLAFCVGCERAASTMVQFGAAPLQRKADFIMAIESALKGFENLNSPGVKIDLIDDSGRKTVSIRADGANHRAVERAVSVVVTNIALKYSGVCFFKMGEGAWKVFIPDETQIPVEGGFDLNIK